MINRPQIPGGFLPDPWQQYFNRLQQYIDALPMAIHQRGLRADQPLPDAVLPGTLYEVSDESVIERSDGTAWTAYYP